MLWARAGRRSWRAEKREYSSFSIVPPRVASAVSIRGRGWRNARCGIRPADADFGGGWAQAGGFFGRRCSAGRPGPWQRREARGAGRGHRSECRRREAARPAGTLLSRRVRRRGCEPFPSCGCRGQAGPARRRLRRQAMRDSIRGTTAGERARPAGARLRRLEAARARRSARHAAQPARWASVCSRSCGGSACSTKALSWSASGWSPDWRCSLMMDRRLRVGLRPSDWRTQQIAKFAAARAGLFRESRGSAPRASSAARLLRPPDWRLSRSCLRRSATRRLSRRLIGGFVHVEDAGNLEKRMAVEEVGGEEEAIFRGKVLQGAGYGVGKVSEFGGDGRRVRLGRWAVEGVERRLAVGAAVVIDVALGECGAQPAEQRAAAGVRGQRGLAHAVDLAQAVQFRVERFGKVVAKRGRAGDGDGGLGEGSTIEPEEALPCDFPAEGAGLSESQLREMERVEEGGLLRGIGKIGGGKAMVVLRADGGEGGAELVQRKAAGLGFRRVPEFLDKSGAGARRGAVWRGGCGGLRSWQWAGRDRRAVTRPCPQTSRYSLQEPWTISDY